MAGEANFTLSESDYLDGQRDWYWRYILSRRGVASLLGPVLLCAVIGVVGELIGDDPPQVVLAALGFALLGGGVVLLIQFGCYLWLPRRNRRLFQQQKSLQGVQRWTWDDAGLEVETQIGTGHHSWSDFFGWAMGRRALLLFLNEQLIYIIPRRHLSEAQQRELEAMLTTRGPARR